MKYFSLCLITLLLFSICGGCSKNNNQNPLSANESGETIFDTIDNTIKNTDNNEHSIGGVKNNPIKPSDSKGSIASQASGDDNTNSEATVDNNNPSGDTEQLEYFSLFDILPELRDLDRISVRPVTAIVGVFAPADEKQAHKILELIKLLNNTAFVEVEQFLDDGYLVSSSALFIENAFSSSAFSIAASVEDNSIVHINLIQGRTFEEIQAGVERPDFKYFKAVSGVFPIRFFNDLLWEVLLDTEDLQNVAIVKKLDSDKPEFNLNKGDTAILRGIFDDTIQQYEEEVNIKEQELDFNYDLELSETIPNFV